MRTLPKMFATVFGDSVFLVVSLIVCFNSETSWNVVALRDRGGTYVPAFHLALPALVETFCEYPKTCTRHSMPQ